MLWLNLTPLILSVVFMIAHFMRAENTGAVAVTAVVPLMLLLKKRWATKIVQLFLLVGAAIWFESTMKFVLIRQDTGQPWLRLVLILGVVASLSVGAALILQKKSLKKRFQKVSAFDFPSGATFVLTAVILGVIQYKVKLPMLIAERFIPGAGWAEILILASYAGWITEKLLDKKQTHIWRKRIWLLFSAVFFGQLILGLSGVEKFLMTSKLHLPIPAMILGGPLYRGNGFFMPILFLSTVVLAGPAWCSYICYIGSWDQTASSKKRKPAVMPRWRHPARIAILLIVPAVAVLLRLFGASSLTAVIFGLSFGIVGVVIMFIWSRKTGVMTHCITWCPIGLLANWLGKLSPFRLKINDTCDECGACSLACRYDALTVFDIQQRKPGLTCTLCGDCIKSCRLNSIEYAFLKLDPEKARTLFIVLVVVLHAVSTGIARI